MSSGGMFVRAYRVALRIYPRAFRVSYGSEMTAFAASRLEQARTRGRIAAAVEMFRLIGDLLASAPRNWLLKSPNGIDLPPSTFPAYPRDHMDIVLQDLRFAVRSLVQRPAFTLVAVLTLALGIGANTAIFSVVNAVLIRPLPYTNPDQLVLIWGTQGAQHQQGVVYADYLDWRTRTRSFSEMGVFRGQSVNITGGDRPDRLTGEFVSASYLRIVGAKAVKGRLFTDAETEVATKAPVAVLSSERWQDRYAGDPNILGKTINVNGSPFTIIGIAAPKLTEPFVGTTDIFLPVGYFPNAKGFDRGVRQMAVAARLKPGVTMDAAAKDVDGIMKQLAQEYPRENAGTGAELISVRDFLVARVRESLYIILGAVMLVLLIACANVANLQLARGASRSRELSVRAALGAGRQRIVQQLLTENVVLALVGGIAGLAVAFGLRKVLVMLVGPQLPVSPGDIRLDPTVLAFALGVSLATGIIFGIVPAWHASRTNLNDTLRTRVRGHASTATRNALVVVQLALSLALLASAGLLTRSLRNLQRVDPGFDGSHLLTAQFRLPANKYDSPEKIWSMFERTAAELNAIPEVESAALVRASPLSQNGESYPVTIEGKPAANAGEAPQIQLNSITSGYFATMRIPVLLGRDVETTDRMGTVPVVVVNKAFADATWPNESPIGKRIRFADDDWRAIVGVVGNAKQFTLNETQLLQAYVPHAQRPQIFTSIVVRTRTEKPLDVAKAVREAIWRVDRDQPVWRFRDMRQDLEGVVTSSKTMMWLTGMFALVALIVAVVGIYGVLSYTMSQRTQEIGIRIALGATSREVTRMVVATGARLIGIAVVVGLAASAGAARVLRNQLFGVAPNDLVTFGVVSVVLAGVAILACYLPARRASRVDPMVALRTD